jgi:hypothetical protein
MAVQQWIVKPIHSKEDREDRHRHDHVHAAPDRGWRLQQELRSARNEVHRQDEIAHEATDPAQAGKVNEMNSSTLSL